LRYTDKFDDPNLPGEMQVTVTLKQVSVGTELTVVQEGIPDATIHLTGNTVIDALLVTRILVQFIGQIFAVMLLRERAPGMQRPYRIHLYPLPPLIALAGWLFLFGSAETSLKNYGALALSLGVALFFVWSWRTRRWPFVFASKEVAAGTKPSD